MSDLSERLQRAYEQWITRGSLSGVRLAPAWLKEAAARLDALEAEQAQHEAEVDHLGREMRAIEDARDENARLWENMRAERDALEAALQQVEWIGDELVESRCPWCGGIEPEAFDFQANWHLEHGDDAFQREHNRGHAPDCPRQRALGLTDELDRDLTDIIREEEENRETPDPHQTR